MLLGFRGFQNWELGFFFFIFDVIGKVSDDGFSDGLRGRQLSNDEVVVLMMMVMDYGYGVCVVVISWEVKSVSFYCQEGC